MYQYDQRPSTRLSDAAQACAQTIRDSEYSVLVGRNNCGKSYLLKTLTQQWGQSASYLGPARYQNFNLLSYYTPNRNRQNEKWNQFVNQWQNQQQNIDNSPLNLQQAIAELSDEQRDKLSDIVLTLLGINLEIRQTVEDNTMSQRYISCGGHNISYTSSGFRLITTLLTSLLDEGFDTFLVDEPELGISPEAQGILADFLFDRDHRKRYFPHIRTLVFATHSTIFLDRKNICNNYMVSKSGDEIDITPATTHSELNRIHFFLLGNRFETLYLPSVIVLVEGKCDLRYIERILSLNFPYSQISAIAANSDARIKEVMSLARGFFTDLQRSPYRDRIFVVLDAVHSASLPSELVSMGLPSENVIVWSKNGIEYFYPEDALNKIYGLGGEIEISGDLVSRNGLTYPKVQLLEKVVPLLTEQTSYPPELVEKLIQPVSERVSAQ